MRSETPYFQVPSFFFYGEGLEVTPGPNPLQFKPRASSTPFLAGRSAGELRTHTAPSSRPLALSACPTAPGALGSEASGVRASTHAAPACTLPTPLAGQRRVGGDVATPSTHMSRSRAAARSPSHPRAGSRRPRRLPGPGHEGRVREKPGRSGGSGRRASPLPWTEGGGIRGAGGGGGVAGATRPPGAGPARDKLRGRRRGLGKDTCCTVLWMVVSGDWDSFSSCRIC